MGKASKRKWLAREIEERAGRPRNLKIDKKIRQMLARAKARDEAIFKLL